MLADASVGEQETGSLTSDHPLPSHKEAWPDFLFVLSEKLVLGGFPCVLQYSRVWLQSHPGDEFQELLHFSQKKKC